MLPNYKPIQQYDNVSDNNRLQPSTTIFWQTHSCVEREWKSPLSVLIFVLVANYSLIAGGNSVAEFIAVWFEGREARKGKAGRAVLLTKLISANYCNGCYEARGSSEGNQNPYEKWRLIVMSQSWMGSASNQSVDILVNICIPYLWFAVLAYRNHYHNFVVPSIDTKPSISTSMLMRTWIEGHLYGCGQHRKKLFLLFSIVFLFVDNGTNSEVTMAVKTNQVFTFTVALCLHHEHPVDTWFAIAMYSFPRVLKPNREVVCIDTLQIFWPDLLNERFDL